MAEKMANSIGRELRYFEYKFRKRQSGKNKKNKKDMTNGSGSQMAWSDGGLRSDDFSYDTPANPEIKKAMPTNKGEEALQVQVALAMSREEEKERSRQQESDELRLKLALKESEQDAVPGPLVRSPQAPGPSLLDMSFGVAPANTNAFGAPPANDPWGAPTVSSAPTFDPFGAPAAQPTVPANNTSNGLTFDLFAAPSAPVQSTVPVQAPVTTGFGNNDLWGQQPTQPAATANNSLDPWGSVAPAVGNPTSTPFSTPSTFQPAQTTDAWGNPTSQAFATPAQQNGNAWGNPGPFSAPQQANFDPFLGGAPAPATTTNNAFGTTSSDFETPPTFDPLKDFDSLHIGGNRAPSPVILQSDFGTTSVAKDIFPIDQLLEPQPLAAASSNGATNQEPVYAQIDDKPKEAKNFLGENSNLVNLDSWKPYQIPYVTKPLGTQSHNPFAATGPSKSLNEMKSSQQQTYGQTVFQ